jgi:hypothetical protein
VIEREHGASVVGRSDGLTGTSAIGESKQPSTSDERRSHDPRNKPVDIQIST